MKEGRTIEQLEHEVARQAILKKDYRATTSALTLRGGSKLLLSLPTENKLFDVDEHTHNQIGTFLDIPAKFYDRLRKDNADILDHVVTELWHRGSQTRLVRTLDGRARAFLSDRYARRDNIDLVKNIWPDLKEAMQTMDMQIVSCEITWRKLYIKFVTPRLTGEVKRGDVVQAGGVISNSEVGEGYCEAYPFLKRLICTNGMAVEEYGQRKAHIGKRVTMEEEAMELYADDTLAADDQAFWLKVRDAVRLTLQPDRFKLLLGKLQESAEVKLEGAKPQAVVEELGNRYALSNAEQESVLTNLMEGGLGLTKWGIANAVTQVANDADSYDRATELERLGGTIISLQPTEWKALAA